MARDKRLSKQPSKPPRELPPPAVGELLEQIQADHAGARQAWGTLRERMLRRRAELREEAMQAQPPRPPASPPLSAPAFPPYPFSAAEQPATHPDDPATVHPLPPEQAAHDFQSFLYEIGDDLPVTPDDFLDDPATVHPLPPEQAAHDFQSFLRTLGDQPTEPDAPFSAAEQPATHPDDPPESLRMGNVAQRSPADSTLAEVEVFIQHLQAELGIPTQPQSAPPTDTAWLPPTPAPPTEEQAESEYEPLDPALTAELMHAFSAYDPPRKPTHAAETAPLPAPAGSRAVDVLTETEALLAELHTALDSPSSALPQAPAVPTLPITELHPEVVQVTPLSGARLERVLHPTTPVQRHLKKIADVAYVQLCRVGLGIRRLLESQSDLHDTQHQRLSGALLELQHHVRALLEELERAYRQTPANERRTLADFVELAGHNMGMLRHELDVTERIAEARQHYLISTYAGEMHRQITLLLYDLQAAYQTIVMEPWRHLLGGPPPPPEHTRSIAPGTGSNDLTRIEGIGIGIQQRLHQAGIYTYARLAQSNADELRLILGNMAPYIDVEAWIQAARQLAS